MITIIGAGNAGKGLGNAFLKLGEKVFFGVREVSKYETAIQLMGPNAQVGTVEEALSLNSSLVILAIPFEAAVKIAQSIPDWSQKILVDISTPWLPDLSGLSLGRDNSAAEVINKAANNARVVKAFNSMGAECFDNRASLNGKVFLPVCSDDQSAKRAIIKLGKLMGFDAIDAGGLKNARATEPLVLLWLQMTFNLPIGRTFEFGLVQKREHMR